MTLCGGYVCMHTYICVCACVHVCACTHVRVSVCVPQINVVHLPQLIFNLSFFESVSLTEPVVAVAGRQAG